MEDRKLKAIAEYMNAALKPPAVIMWFVIPGGMISGEPITVEQYYEIISDEPVTEIEDMNPAGQDRFFYLKNISFNGVPMRSTKAAIVDGTQVSAWGSLEAT